MEHQLRITDLVSLALTDEMGRGLRGVQDGLHVLRAELHDDATLLQPDAGIGRLLNRCAKIMPLTRKIWLIDRDGGLLSASDSTPPPDLRAFLPPLERMADNAPAVSRPFTDPTTREALVALAIRFDEPTGSISAASTGGWIIAGIPASALFGARQ